MLPSIKSLTLARVVNHINNPNHPAGTLIEEIPTDFGRSYAGYKRGGILEGAEKFRKEVLSAIVWLWGMKEINKGLNTFCEKTLNIPTGIEYSNSKDGIDAIKNSVGYIKANDKQAFLKQNNLVGIDVSEIEKYCKSDKFKNITVGQVKVAKQVTSIIALVAQCAIMGWILPKFNQAITARKLKKMQQKKYHQKFDSFDEFKNASQKNTKSGKGEISFKGLVENAADYVTYKVENSSRFRLVSIDAPMVLGRVMTARNRYEALEIAFMDIVSTYFYNFSSGNIQSLLRKITSTPNIDPIVAQYIAKMDKNVLDDAFKVVSENKEAKPLRELFSNSEEAVKEIYKTATYGKYNKINKFIKDDDLRAIDKNVCDFLQKAKEENISFDKLADFAKNVNKKNAIFLSIGLIISIIGLAILVPKWTFMITQKLTGKNTFSGITNYDDDKDGKNKHKSAAKNKNN